MSLLELLVVLAVLSVLFLLTACAIQRARIAAVRLECANRLRQLGLALSSYHGDHQHFPPGTAHPSGQRAIYGPDLHPYSMLNWSGRLLPYLEQEAVWQAVVAYYKAYPSLNIYPQVAATELRCFVCPAQPALPDPHPQRLAPLTYLGVSGTNDYQQDGILFLDSSIRFTDITDGSSNTLIVGERPRVPLTTAGRWFGGPGDWGVTDAYLGVEETRLPMAGPCLDIPPPYRAERFDADCAPYHFWSHHPSGSNFLFADGSVRFLPYSAASTLSALATRGEGDDVNGNE